MSQENHLKRNHSEALSQEDGPSYQDCNSSDTKYETNSILHDQQQVKKRKIKEQETTSQESTNSIPSKTEKISELSNNNNTKLTHNTSSKSHYKGIGRKINLGILPSAYLLDFQDPKLLYETQVSLSKVPEYCWVLIYSFLSLENYFVNRIYKLNSRLKENLYDSKLFWEAIACRIWVISNSTSVSVKNCRDFAFLKYLAYETHKYAHPQIQILQEFDQAYPKISKLVLHANFDSECFIINNHQNNITYCKRNNYLVNSNVNLCMNIFMKSAPKIVGLGVLANLNHDGTVDLKLEAYFNRTIYKIIDDEDEVVMLSGIKKLFEGLGLESNVHLNPTTRLDPRFERLKFGELMTSPYFIWFCNSILVHVPFPIEQIYERVDYSDHLCFGIDEERNLIVEEYYKCKKILDL